MRALKKRKYEFFPMNEIRAEGYILNQLRIQANGLSGNLHTFWGDIKDSKWIGGDKEGWERVPYWLDGFIPLAFLLEDEEMKKVAKRYVDKIIEGQKEDGWICPCENDQRGRYDMWACFLILKVLTVWHDATNDERVFNVIYKALKNLNQHIDWFMLFDWAQTRWYEGLISVYWLAERCDEEWISGLVNKLKNQGFDFYRFYKHWNYTKPTPKGMWSQMSHVVNNAMMLKGDSLYYLWSGDKKDLKHARYMLDKLDKYHGSVTGVFTGDECLAGTSPLQGTELCAVAELMYSLEHLVSIDGNSYWADRLDSVTFNALFATFSPDMWTHQYDQQVNQVQCSTVDGDNLWTTNNGQSHLFGLEPNYGCCTSNLSQALPKYVLSSFMKAQDGVAIVNLSPASLKTKINGGNVEVQVFGEYPFNDKVIVKYNTEKEITLHIRIPKWANATIDGKQALNGEFNCISVEGAGQIELCLESEIQLVKRPQNMYAIKKGALVYSLKIEEEWKQINQDLPEHEFPHCDYEVFPTSKWNYAIVSEDMRFENVKIDGCPFDHQKTPNKIFVKCKEIEWGMEKGSANRIPSGKKCCGVVQEKVFIPYGATNLRLTEMPLRKDEK